MKAGEDTPSSPLPASCSDRRLITESSAGSTDYLRGSRLAQSEGGRERDREGETERQREGEGSLRKREAERKKDRVREEQDGERTRER